MSYFGVGVATYCNVDRAWCTLAQDCIDVIQCHVVNHSVVDLHDLISTPKGREKVGKEKKYSYFHCKLLQNHLNLSFSFLCCVLNNFHSGSAILPVVAYPCRHTEGL